MLKWTALATLGALAVYFTMLFRVGQARGRTGLKAPATTGNEVFERAYRVQMNTLEGLPLFLPSLWLAAYYVDDRLAAVLGLVWIIGRLLYMQAYTTDPAKRGIGFATQGVAIIVLYIVAAIGIIRVFVA